MSNHTDDRASGFEDQGNTVDINAVIDEILEWQGLDNPPLGAFTITEYIERAKTKGKSMGRETASRFLQDSVSQGILDCRQFVVGGHRKWLFWKRE